MKEIPLTRGLVALVDDEDYERVMQFKWLAASRNWSAGGFVAVRFSSRKEKPRRAIALHRFIVGVVDSHTKVDHRNHDGLDCQRHNLRACTNAQNVRNMLPRGGSSDYKGVRLDTKYKKWRADIRVNYKKIFLGYHLTEEDAARAYDRAAVEHFGEFALTNYPLPKSEEADILPLAKPGI